MRVVEMSRGMFENICRAAVTQLKKDVEVFRKAESPLAAAQEKFIQDIENLCDEVSDADEIEVID